jgi:hypothetical protein
MNAWPPACRRLAGPLPLIALAGMLALSFGGLLNLYRRRR